MAKISLYYPVTPVRFNQYFGTNGEYYRANGIKIVGHNGNDLDTYHGQPVYAAHDGTAYYEKDDGGGHGVVIVSDKPYDYKGKQAWFKTIYWHFCDPALEPKYASPIYVLAGNRWNSGVGFPVKAGDLIGYADSTGLSTGDHLHFGLKPIIPGPGITAGDAPDVGIGNWVNVDQNNGYLGAIDPAPYWNTNFAGDAPKVIANLSAQVSLLSKMVDLFTKLYRK